MMFPILSRYGSFFLYSYTVVMGLGIAAALLFAYFPLRAAPKRWAAWWDGWLAGMLAGLCAGRLVFVAAHRSYFAAHPDEMIRIGQGGLSYHAVLIAGLCAFCLWQGWQGEALSGQLHLLAVPLILLTGFGWLACYLEGCAYGQETILGWLSHDLPDSYGVFQVRYQTQLLGLVWSGVVLGIVGGWKGRGRVPGSSFWLALGLLSAGRAAINTLRGDPMPTWNGLRLDILADTALAIIASLVFTVTFLRSSTVRRPLTPQ